MMMNCLIDGLQSDLILDQELPWETRRASVFSFLVSLFWYILQKFDDVYLDKNMHNSGFIRIAYESWLLCRNSGWDVFSAKAAFLSSREVRRYAMQCAITGLRSKPV